MADKYPDDIYVLCSDDPLLKLDTSQEILQNWRAKVPQAEFLLYTFSELQGSGSNYRFQDIETEMADPGLFGGERIIKIVLKDLDGLAVELFKLIAANKRPGLFILIDMPRINAKLTQGKELDASSLHRFLSFTGDSDGARALAAQEQKEKKGSKRSSVKSKAKAPRKGEAAKSEAIGYLRNVGAKIIILYPPEGPELKRWISNRAAGKGFKITPEALDYIALSCDNNLLSIDHSLQVLEMLKAEGSGQVLLTLDMVEEYFTQDARYTGYELPLAIFNNEPLRALSIIASFCSGLEMNLNAALGLLINRMDASLNAIYEGKLKNIVRADKIARTAFFMSHNIKVFTSQESHLKAMRNLSIQKLDLMSACLSEASCAYSSFDFDGAYRALQRLAVSCAAPDEYIKYLSSDLLRT